MINLTKQETELLEDTLLWILENDVISGTHQKIFNNIIEKLNND